MAGETSPRVWVLLGKGAGGNAQMRLLAQALGWPWEERALRYNALERLPGLLLGDSGASIDRRRSDVLEPPWPDLVIGASRRSAPVARWIRRQSGGRTRLVHLFHVQAPLRHFDLVVTLPQYRLPPKPNVLHLTGALNRIDPARLEEAAKRWRPTFEALPQPWIALVVGGNSSSYVFDPETAARLGREASARARAAGGSLLVSTTPRTPAASADALFAAIDAPAWSYRWRPDDDANPYLGYLALAERFIVTVDSASLPMEACATGRPVEVFEWPRRRTPAVALRGLLARGPGARVYEALVEWGLVKPPRDFDAYHRVLRERGLASRLGDPPAARGELPDDLALAVQHIRRLMQERPGGSTS